MEDQSWEPELDELRRREALALRMGGAEKVERQHDGGKLTVRERIDALLDAGSFHEVGASPGGPPTTTTASSSTHAPPTSSWDAAGSTAGPWSSAATTSPCAGGAADASIFQKQVHAERMAHELRLPIVRLVDGSGGGGIGQDRSRPTGAPSCPFNPGWERVVANLATVPVVAPLPRLGRRARRGARRHEPLLA